MLTDLKPTQYKDFCGAIYNDRLQLSFWLLFSIFGNVGDFWNNR